MPGEPERRAQLPRPGVLPPPAKVTLCISFGTTCPWNPAFFDCGPGGCNETFVQIDDFISPDPTRTVTFEVVASDDRVVVVAPAPGLSLGQSAAILSGAGARGPVARSGLNHLRVLGADGAVRGSIAVYGADNVSVGNLKGRKNVLQLDFGAEGRSIAIHGGYLPPHKPPRRFPYRGSTR